MSTLCKTSVGDESVPIQMAQCWFPGLAISNAKIVIYFSNRIHGSNFIKQHSETVMVFKLSKRWQFKMNLLYYLL